MKNYNYIKNKLQEYSNCMRKQDVFLHDYFNDNFIGDIEINDFNCTLKDDILTIVIDTDYFKVTYNVIDDKEFKSIPCKLLNYHSNNKGKKSMLLCNQGIEQKKLWSKLEWCLCDNF